MNTLLLIRHAHTHMAGRFCGHSDPELSSIGHGQLSEIATQVQRWPLSIVYASDLKRAAQTAEAIASPRELNVRLRPSLREIYFGDWEGRSWDETEAADPAFAASWLKAYPNNTPPGGETFHDFEQRVRDELAALAVLIDREVAATVTHAGFIRTALSLISGAPIRSIANLDYGSVTELRLVEQKWTVAEK
jgi:alpha-ribazole phosphatase/probable phosphoglycerate mutase